MSTTKQYLEGHVDRSLLETPEARTLMELSRKVRFIISTDSKDRHGTVLNMKGWNIDRFNANPIVGYQHNVYGDNMCSGPNPDDVLGPGRAWLEESGGKTRLMGEVTFETAEINPLADKIFKKILNGTLNATSVGFLEVGKGKMITTKDESGNVIDKTYHYEGQELLEFSVVNIPSNPDATKKSFLNHTRAGINFLLRAGLKVNDVRKVANEILDQIEKNEKPEVEELNSPDPKLDDYRRRLKLLKN